MTEAKKAKRKLIKTGTYTYMVTLPKEWVQKLGCDLPLLVVPIAVREQWLI